MRKLIRLFGVAALVLTGWALAPSAQAETHGCVSSSNVINVTSGDGGPVKTGDCTFTMVEGDTYSGVGPFTISCPGGKKIEHAASAAPVAQVVLECKPGVIVTVDASPGGTVAAGSPT